MKRFAELLDRLSYEPGRNNKLRLMTDYFRHTPDPDRGYALAALTGSLSFQYAKPNVLRTLITERVDPVLFALSRDYVGDTSETIALMWPAPVLRTRSTPLPPPEARSRASATRYGGGEGSGVGGEAASAEVPPTPNPSPPHASHVGGGGRTERASNTVPQATSALSLSDIVVTISTLGKSQLPAQLARWLDALDETGRWALLKLVTGALRIGVSARLAKTAAAALGDKDVQEIELIWPGLAPPYTELFAWLEGRAEKPSSNDPAPFRPAMLAHAIEE
ncbi:MAG TPA: ATP-dependent DNA ligase, partial [Xanthobacteraceae bacterium]|nr:ATP-dependent DNA ligase [Xanthobacteraceae bacterium]